MAGKLTGRAFIRVDGDLLPTLEGAKINIGGLEREEVLGNEVLGFTEKPVAATVECTIAHSAATDLVALRNITDATVTFETDTGITYMVAPAWITKPPELTAGGAEVELEFKGPPATQL